MTVLSNVGGQHEKYPLSPAQLVEMQRLWEEELDLSASQIAELMGVTKNVVIGHAHRRGWAERRPWREPMTSMQRLDALNLFPEKNCCSEASYQRMREWEADPERKLKAAARGAAQWESA